MREWLVSIYGGLDDGLCFLQIDGSGGPRFHACSEKATRVTKRKGRAIVRALRQFVNRATLMHVNESQLVAIDRFSQSAEDAHEVLEREWRKFGKAIKESMPTAKDLSVHQQGVREYLNSLRD